MKPKYHFNETYMVNIYYFIGWDWLAFVKHLADKFDYKVSSEIPPCGHSVWNYEKGKFFIYTKKKADSSILAHEVLHVTNRILDRAGVLANHQNDEAQCYLFSEIMRKAK